MADRIVVGTQDALTQTAGTRDKGRSVGGAKKVQEYGRSMVNQLFMLMRTVKVHDMNNTAFEKPLQNLCQTINTILAMEGKTTIYAVEDSIYVNDVKIKPDATSYQNLQWLAREFTRR